MNRVHDEIIGVAMMFAKLALRTEEARESMTNFVNSVKPIRLNVRDHWNPNKIIGTLPWDGFSDCTRFEWHRSVDGYIRRDILTLAVCKFAAGEGDATELAYDTGMHDIEVLRKLPGFQELV